MAEHLIIPPYKQTFWKWTEALLRLQSQIFNETFNWVHFFEKSWEILHFFPLLFDISKHEPFLKNPQISGENEFFLKFTIYLLFCFTVNSL